GFKRFRSTEGRFRSRGVKLDSVLPRRCAAMIFDVSVTKSKMPVLQAGQVLKVSFSRGGPFEVTVVRPLGPTKTVYLGRRVGTEEPFVLKLPRGGPGIEDRIEREITAQFDHPNLIRLVGTAVVEGRTILVLPKLAP